MSRTDLTIDLLFNPLLQAEEEQDEGRIAILNYLRKELIGPVDGEREEIEGEPPHKRYTMGILFPVEASMDKETEGEEEEAAGSSGREEMTDDPVTLAGQWMPSSMGLSFFYIGEPGVQVSVYGAKYLKSKGGKNLWLRQPLAEQESPEVISISPINSRCEVSVLDDNATIVGHWRQLGNGFLVTITLVNSHKKKGVDVNGEECLCQSGFSCIPISGKIQEYPSLKINTADLEEQELQLLYRKNKVFAVGHGCSADWNINNTLPAVLRTQVIPTAYVPAMTHDLNEAPEILKVARLANPAEVKEVIVNELDAFIKIYETWILNLDIKHPDIPPRLSNAKSLILERLYTALKRMKAGVECLRKDDLAWKAFRLANYAMLIQMKHSSKDLAGERKTRNQAKTSGVNYFELEFKWRPFQLAFQLLTIESVLNEKSEFRELVDLIWFPTGGGKTEAYLALAAFEIFHRRLKFGKRGGGTAVITRYTLRLLTSQQFQRSSRLIAACEYLRRKNTVELGTEVITIGFWAGKETSPNDYNTALENLGKIKESSSPINQNVFQIDACPWCGTELLPSYTSEDEEDFGFECTNLSFRVFCPSENCQFHDFIPVTVIDEDLYKNPPTFLIATVDKFARMAWVEGAGAFFGKKFFLTTVTCYPRRTPPAIRTTWHNCSSL